MSGIRAILFDCYSTLIDIKTDEGKPEVFDHLSRYLQYYGATMDSQKLKRAFESEKKKFLQTEKERYPEVDLEIVFNHILREEGLANAALAESCCKLFRVLSRERLQLFPDTLPVLEAIRQEGYSLAVVSDAQKSFCLDEGRILGIESFFDHIVLSTHFGFRKPDSRLFSIACNLLEVTPPEAVFVGDHPDKDVSGAKQIGMSVILIDRSSRNRGSDLPPDFQAKNLWEAWRWIRQLR